MLALMPSGQSTAPRPQDFQKISELVNKFVINTVHLMNTFASTCESRLTSTARTMQRLECQVTLLEYKLDSIDRDDPAAAEDGKSRRNRHGSTTDGTAAALGGVPAITAGPSGQRAPRSGLQLPVPKGGREAPAMPSGKSRKGPPPVPGSGGPPAPPAAIVVPPPPPPIAPGAPPLIGTPPPPPPMPPTSAGLTMKNHPRLAGYFKMAAAGVAAVAIKAKMKADGHNPDWFDSPNMPAPLPAIKKGAAAPDLDSD